MRNDEFSNEIRTGLYARIGGALIQYGSVIGAALTFKEYPLSLAAGAALYIMGELARAAGEGMTTNALIKKREKESRLEKIEP